MGRRCRWDRDCGGIALHRLHRPRRGRLTSESISLVIGDPKVSAISIEPARATSCFVFAHGAGAGMNHAFMCAFAQGLAKRGVATLRYQFPYMERGSRRPDVPAVCHATVRAAVGAVRQRAPHLAIIAGGKSFGGRMTSQAQAMEALPGVGGLAFLGFPLHPVGKPSVGRAAHLKRIQLPMLFLQGEKDQLADAALLGPLITELGDGATLEWLPQADHSFHVTKRSGGSDEQTLTSMLDSFAGWASSLRR